MVSFAGVALFEYLRSIPSEAVIAYHTYILHVRPFLHWFWVRPAQFARSRSVHTDHDGLERVRPREYDGFENAFTMLLHQLHLRKMRTKTAAGACSSSFLLCYFFSLAHSSPATASIWGPAHTKLMEFSAAASR